MIDIKKVIREAAVKNKLVIKDDDPVMLFASTLNLMLNELDASLAAVLYGSRKLLLMGPQPKYGDAQF